MSIAQTVQTRLAFMPSGQVFSYQDIPDYETYPAAVTKTLSRLVATGRLQRLSKGKFYVPKAGVLGARKPSDNEIIKSSLYKGGRLFGYVTGLSLYNRLGLTTQVPRTVMVACNGGRQIKEFGTIRIKTVTARAPVKEQDVKLLQYLDVLKDIKKIPDAEIGLILKRMHRYVEELSDTDRQRLAELAKSYYTPQARALAGLLLSSLGFGKLSISAFDLNPLTTYTIGLNKNEWPQADEWNIR